MGSNGQLGPLLKCLQGCDLSVRDVGGHKVQEALQDHFGAVVHEVLLGGQFSQIVLLTEEALVILVAQFPLGSSSRPLAAQALLWPCLL